MARTGSGPTALVVFDDACVSDLWPLAVLRPACDIKVGALDLREKLERYTGLPVVGVHSPDLGFRIETGSSESFAEHANMLAVNSRVICDPTIAAELAGTPEGVVRISEGAIVAVRMRSSAVTRFMEERKQWETMPSVPISARLIAKPWDAIRHLERELDADLRLLRESIGSMHEGREFSALQSAREVSGVQFYSSERIVVGSDTRIFPHVVINAESGPVVIGSRCRIMPFSYIEGPCSIADDTVVKTHSSISRSSIGPGCRVSGEISASIFHAFVNKQHEGFVGHSYMAPWVNLGAGTITSNLKNTYGMVRATTATGAADTGMQFLGTIAGDHSKFGINTMLSTGTIVGVACNVYGAGFPEKRIPSFHWGQTGTYDVERLIDTIRTVMDRRNRRFSPEDETRLRTAHQRAV